MRISVRLFNGVRLTRSRTITVPYVVVPVLTSDPVRRSVSPGFGACGAISVMLTWTGEVLDSAAAAAGTLEAAGAASAAGV